MITSEELDGQFPKNRVVYKGRTIPGRDGYYPMDVRHFVFYPDTRLEAAILHTILNVESVKQRKLTDDEKAYLCEAWVRKEITYAPDNSCEFWQLPSETLFLGHGDCEDIAILCASMMLCAGIPTHRVKVAVGNIHYNGLDSAHCFVLYYRDSESWVPVDPSRPEALGSVNTRTKVKDDTFYTDITFTFNHLNSWGDKDQDVDAPLAMGAAVLIVEGE